LQFHTANRARASIETAENQSDAKRAAIDPFHSNQRCSNGLALVRSCQHVLLTVFPKISICRG